MQISQQLKTVLSDLSKKEIHGRVLQKMVPDGCVKHLV